jgi:hypothetical protein
MDLADALVADTDAILTSSMESFTRTLRIHGPIASEALRVAVYTLFKHTRRLRVLNIQPMPVDTSCLCIIQFLHTNTLEKVHIRLSSYHSVDTLILEELPHLRRLAITFDGTGRGTFTGRPLTGHRQTKLCSLILEVAPTCNVSQHVSVMHLIHGAKFPSIAHVTFNIQSEQDVGISTNAMLHFLGNHPKLTSTTLDLAPQLLSATLPHVRTPTVSLCSYDGSVPIAVALSCDVSLLYITGYYEQGFGDDFHFLVASLLYGLSGRIGAQPFSGEKMALRAVKFPELEWPAGRDITAHPYVDRLVSIAHTLLAQRVRIVDRNNMDTVGEVCVSGDFSLLHALTTTFRNCALGTGSRHVCGVLTTLLKRSRRMSQLQSQQLSSLTSYMMAARHGAMLNSGSLHKI